MTNNQTTQPARFPCVMSGEREVLTIEPLGFCGVSFAYGDDASVIVDGEDLLRIRAILDVQIAKWQGAHKLGVLAARGAKP
jgi:hypothetical protein